MNNMDGMTDGRPAAAKLLRVMVDRPGKLTYVGRNAATAEWRCPRRHLLAAVIKTLQGPWLYWHGSPLGDGWQHAWQADLDSLSVSAWCSCPNTWTVDIAAPGTPPALALG